MEQMYGQINLFEPEKPVVPENSAFSREPFKESCYNCKFLNKKKKKITGTHNQLIDYGCKADGKDYVPGGTPKEQEYWLGYMSCGMWQRKW